MATICAMLSNNKCDISAEILTVIIIANCLHIEYSTHPSLQYNTNYTSMHCYSIFPRDEYTTCGYAVMSIQFDQK